MKDILTEITDRKRADLVELKKALPMDQLVRLALKKEESDRSMSRALARSSSGIIAEFKRKSPSKGWIHQDADPAEVITQYQAYGASALSILTDEPYFGGDLDFIYRVRELIEIPILRKDFIIDEYQLYEARLVGADAVLLIAACLSMDECRFLMDRAHELGMEVLLETHSEEEMKYASLGADMVGINNRNLGTFHTDVQNSFRLAELLKSSVKASTACGFEKPVLVSESGISDPQTVRELRKAGFRGFLMGENFMKHSDPGQALKDFIGEL